ncbi:shikimate dehydrogenase [Fulvivirga ligni]|uniref:shikimate dehydrogenase n=1 Tax=Fulvivirga ligni TaxID=2904246 RepID=UPI001F2EBFA5|nr:shikimate dehydrogenase [Fulvivirga ligni]UII23580.1 shikimate dehydrogenase [Fulvivirga ligni]
MISSPVAPSPSDAVTTFLNAKKFAFLIHLRHTYSDDMGLYWKPLRKIPNKVYRKIFTKLQAPSVKWSDIYLNGSAGEKWHIGRNEIILLNGKDILDQGPKNMSKNIERVIDKMTQKGYTNIGLGALTSPMTLGGALLKHRQDVSITNGNAFTATGLFRAIVKLLEASPNLMDHQTIVGATGSVGSCLAGLLVKKNYCDKLLLVARNLSKLEKLKNDLKSINPNVQIEVSNQISEIRKSNLITLLTASADNIIGPEILKSNAVILDGTQPRNTSPELLVQRPDVTVIDGGIISIPGITMSNGGIGLPLNHYYACFSETLLWALDGQSEHFSIGNPTLEQAEYMDTLARKYKMFGFELADFTSFGKPLTNSFIS